MYKYIFENNNNVDIKLYRYAEWRNKNNQTVMSIKKNKQKQTGWCTTKYHWTTETHIERNGTVSNNTQDQCNICNRTKV